MANIGPTTAWYNVETSLTRTNNEANNSRERIAAGKQNANAGDRASNSAIMDAFRLDHVSTKAGIKGASVVMGYLETGMRVIGSASTLLARLQELAVLGANGTNTFEELEMINTEAEATAQEFNRLMQGAEYKGKNVFVDTAGSEYLSMGGRNAEMTFGLGKIEYSELFSALRKVQEGLPNAGQLVSLVKLPSDAILGNNVNFETVVGTDSLEIGVSSNLGRPDLLTLQDTGPVKIDGNGVISYTFNHPEQGNTTVEIGEIDANKNGSQGILKVNFYADATIRGTSDLLNGDFSSTMTEVVSYTEILKTVNMERTRNGFISALRDKNGNAITMGAIADVDRTYKNVELSYKAGQAGTAGTGTVRAHIQTATVSGVETITNMEIIDGGQDFKTNEIFVIPARTGINFNGNIAGNEITITSVTDNHKHTLTQARTTNTFGNQTWGPGESGQYTWDANGAPAVDGNNLTYSPGDLKKRQVVNVIQVKDTWGVGESGFYDFDANGAPATGAARLAYNAGDIKRQQVVGSTTGNLTWGVGESGFYDFDADGAPATGAARLAYKAGDIKQRSVETTTIVGDSPVTSYSLENVTGPVPTYSLANVMVDQKNYSLANITGPVPTYSLANVMVDQKNYSLANVMVDQKNYSLANVTGPVPSYSLADIMVDQNVYSLANIYGSTGPRYDGETILQEQVTDYFRPNTKKVPTNWTRYTDRIDFGSNFTISEFANQTKDVVSATNGTVNTAPRVEFSVPTPTEAQMVKPTYADAFGRVAEDAVKGNDDTAVASRTTDMDITVEGGALKLDTGRFNFSKGFGIFHGPATVSDVFSADKNDYLKLDYTAQGVNDDYHVAGYIYEVNPDGSAKSGPIMSLNETGTAANGRSSVRVPETGNYRFVFIVGTHDLTGGKLAGADMTIDNIVAEEGFSVNEDAITALLKTVNYNNSDTISGDTKTVTSTITNNGSTLLTDEVINNLKGFNSNEILPTLNLVSSESDVATQFEEINVSVLTSKIEEVQQLLNNARVQAGSQYMALESALTSTTDLTTQYEMGYNMLHDLDLSNETAELTKKQILQQAATALLAQANNGQQGLLKMLTR
jgi:flagellin-like hook-associated protein FlgL